MDKVQKLARQLKEKGYIDCKKGKSRSIRLTVGNMPLHGVIQAGYVEEQPVDIPNYIDVSGTQYTSKDYALKVQGDSMVGAHICAGDFVILRPVKQIDELKQGTITAVWVEGEGTTLKHLYVQGGTVRLEAANGKYPAQTFDSDQVRPQGFLIGLHRSYD